MPLCFSLFPFSRCRSSPSFFSFLPSFLLSPFLRMPSFMRGAFSFFLSSQTKRKKADVFLSLCPSFLRKEEEKTSVQGREKSVTDDIPETLFFFVFVFCFFSSPFFVGFFVLGKRRKGRREAFRPPQEGRTSPVTAIFAKGGTVYRVRWKNFPEDRFKPILREYVSCQQKEGEKAESGKKDVGAFPHLFQKACRKEEFHA